MLRICMAGACGRMGRRVLECAAAAQDIEIGGALDLPDNVGSMTIGGESGNAQVIQVTAEPGKALEGCHVLIDFSHAAGCVDNVRSAAKRGIPSVLATTGLTPEQDADVQRIAHEAAVIYASNTSLGVNLLFKLTSLVSEALGEDFNIEIAEIHHNQKVDSPSGTAVTLGKRAAESRGLDYGDAAVHGREGHVGKRTAREIGMHALRGGDVPGEHTVYFFGPGERIELTHRALTRDIFARGALTAARFAAQAKPGLYDMQDVLGLK